MSYLGKTQLKSSDIQRFDVTSSTSATHVLSWTAPNEQSLIITINGVKQQDDAYSIAGSPTTVTLTDALVSTDKLEVVGIVDVGTMNVPGVGSVQTDQLADDAVTADKLANSINTEIAANTAKVTNATHTGDVTGATALTIAVDAVDIAMLSATGTASATTFLRGDNAWAAPSGGKVLQVTEGSTAVTVTNNTETYADTGLTATLTTTADNSKVLVIVFQNGLLRTAGSSFSHAVTLTLDEDAGTDRNSYTYLMYGHGASGYVTDFRNMSLAFHYLTAAVTSASTAKTFKTKFKNTTATAGTGAWQYTGPSTMVLMEIAA